MALIEINRDPPLKELRKFGLIWFPLFCGVLGTVLWHKTGILPLAIAIYCLAPPTFLLGLLAPRAVKPIFVGLTYLTFPIGWTISHIMLGVIYFGIMTPIGLLLRLSGKDPLRRKVSPDAKTHWLTREDDGSDTSKYFRQF
jgi:hypothetical protein